jgi:hypothetical protein
MPETAGRKATSAHAAIATTVASWPRGARPAQGIAKQPHSSVAAKADRDGAARFQHGEAHPAQGCTAFASKRLDQLGSRDTLLYERQTPDLAVAH